jgi:2-polyprenyl-6-methoxyphenol hydroxylase-like FAD-dependent oxidoreductase
MKIAISGAGIAGPALAFWLQRLGHEPTLIEHAARFRSGGYIIDFWGVGFDVAERMGLIAPIRSAGYDVQEVRLVNARGKITGGFSADVFRRMTHDRYTSVARGDLAKVTYDSICNKVETLFGEAIASIEDTGSEVVVELLGGSFRHFDLIVGADGLHSQVRRLVWGEHQLFERALGYHFAAFEVAGYPHRDPDIYVSYAEPGLSISRFAMRDDRSLFLLIFADRHLPANEPHDDAGRKSTLRSVFGRCGWETPEIMSALDSAQEVYFDRVSQIEVPSWSRGRTVLVGDAAACPSLLAGEGAGLALTEAYVLASELHRSGSDFAGAFGAYEDRLRGFVTDKAKSARKFASSFAPKTAFGIWLRNVATRLMVIPPVADLLIDANVKDDFDLPITKSDPTSL